MGYTRVRSVWRAAAVTLLGLSMSVAPHLTGSAQAQQLAPARHGAAQSAAEGAAQGIAVGRSAPTARYLSLGDSLAAGYEPAHDDRPAGDNRSGGYVGVVAAGLAQRGRPMSVTNIACSGETSRTMIEGGSCRYRAGSQLAQARQFLRRNPQTRVVTVTIGANDVRRCLVSNKVDIRCTAKELKALNKRLDVILGTLRTAAPQAQIVVLDYYNPYLAARLNGEQGRRLAVATALVQSQLNAVIRYQAAGNGARTARVAAAFDSQDLWPVELPGVGKVPRNVARICTWTWMCSAVDIHANTTGYDIMGQAVLTRLDDSR